jgi:LysM repeat protein
LIVSATPFAYTVRVGDTLSGIAEQFGVPLDVLQSANPGVSPTGMSIGAVLRIPSEPSISAAGATPTPALLTITQVSCLPTADGRTWCVALAQNDGAEAVENVAAEIILLDTTGGLVASQTAHLQLNLLPARAALPLTTLFEAELPEGLTARAMIRSAVTLLPDDPRYLSASIRGALVEVSWAGYSAELTGSVSLEDEAAAAATVWILATAYDRGGRVVGTRRWESGSGLNRVRPCRLHSRCGPFWPDQ